jgi:hypothetical protein
MLKFFRLDRRYAVKKFLLAALVVGLLAAPLLARAGWDQAEVGRQTVVVAPAGAAVDVRADATGRLFAVVAEWKGGPLPAFKTIVLSLTPPVTGTVHASHFLGGPWGAPHQTAPAWVRSLGDVPVRTQYALWQEASGEWGAMIPLVGGGLRTWLSGSSGKLIATADSMANNFAPRRAPMFAIGWGQDPFKLTRDLYAFAFQTMRAEDPKVIGRPRWEKAYPDAYRYIGWCSWNAYYRNISEEKLIRHAKHFRDSGFPLRMILVDDCWMQVNKHTMNPWSQGTLYLTGLDADPKTFPGGLAQTVRILKQDYGISYVGLWHTFEGYWNGVQLGSPAAVAGAIMPVTEESGVPDPRSDAGFLFWDAYYKVLAGAGVDFVKVDNQGPMTAMLNGAVPVSFAMGQAQDNLQRAAEKYFKSDVMNCMEMNIDVVYQWRTTNLGRSVVDYVPISYVDPRSNTLTNVYNTLWFGNVSWPDYDMFMSNDGHVYYYTTARALSGGPIYITDKLGQEKWDELWPTIFSDGEIIRADEPGLPARQTLLENPYWSGKPVIMFSRTGAGGALGLWNANAFFLPVKAEIGPADVEGLAGERFAMYEHFTQTVKVLQANERMPVRLGPWQARVYTVWPVTDGFAPIGLTDKYLAGGAVAEVVHDEGAVTVKLKDAGRFAAYSERKPAAVKVNGVEVEAGRVSYDRGLLRVELQKSGQREPVTVEMIFR